MASPHLRKLDLPPFTCAQTSALHPSLRLSSMRKFLLSAITTLSLFAPSLAMAAEPPIHLISAQIQMQPTETTPDSVPVVITGESDSSVFIVGDVLKSYDFALYDAAKKRDTAQSPSGFSYILDGALSKETPTGKYSFVIRYWLDKGAKNPLALYYKGKPISNAVTVKGKYEGSPF